MVNVPYSCINIYLLLRSDVDDSIYCRDMANHDPSNFFVIVSLSLTKWNLFANHKSCTIPSNKGQKTLRTTMSSRRKLKPESTKGPSPIPTSIPTSELNETTVLGESGDWFFLESNNTDDEARSGTLDEEATSEPLSKKASKSTKAPSTKAPKSGKSTKAPKSSKQSGLTSKLNKKSKTGKSFAWLLDGENTPDQHYQEPKCGPKQDMFVCSSSLDFGVNEDWVTLDSKLFCRMTDVENFGFVDASRMEGLCTSRTTLTKWMYFDLEIVESKAELEDCRVYACPADSSLGRRQGFAIECQNSLLDTCVSIDCDGRCNGMTEPELNILPPVPTSAPSIGCKTILDGIEICRDPTESPTKSPTKPKPTPAPQTTQPQNNFKATSDSGAYGEPLILLGLVTVTIFARMIVGH